jgi:hypothetical protein
VRNLNGNAEVEHVGGDLIFRTAFAAGTVHRFSVGGRARFHVTAPAHVRFVAPLGTAFHLEPGMTAVEEGETLIVTLGDASATVHIQAGGGVRISHRDESDEIDLSDFEEDLDTRLADMAAQLNAHFASLETRLDTEITGQVRERVGRDMDAVRRHLEAAQRRVEEAIRRAQREGMRHVEFHKAPPGPAVSAEPVSDEERLMILQMVEQGRISVEDAERLLAALEGEG